MLRNNGEICWAPSPVFYIPVGSLSNSVHPVSQFTYKMVCASEKKMKQRNSRRNNMTDTTISWNNMTDTTISCEVY